MAIYMLSIYSNQHQVNSNGVIVGVHCEVSFLHIYLHVYKHYYWYVYVHMCYRVGTLDFKQHNETFIAI